MTRAQLSALRSATWRVAADKVIADPKEADKPVVLAAVINDSRD